MCNILVAKTNVPFVKKDLMMSALKNPHGAGYHNVTTGEIYKSMDVDEITEKAMEQPVEHDVIVHYRYATRGDKSIDNLQPVETRFGSVSMNGTLTGSDFTDRKKSDTIVFAEMLCNMAIDWEDFRPLQALELFEISRFVIATAHGIIIVNEDTGVYRNDVWSSKPSTYDSVIPIAVYGTLRKGYGNHYYHLSNALFVGEGETVEELSLYVSGLPYLVRPEGDIASRSHVKVEVYYVTKDELEDIDKLEGHPSHYKREEIMINVDGKEIKAWTYFYQYSPNGVITNDFESVESKKVIQQLGFFNPVKRNYFYSDTDEIEDIEDEIEELPYDEENPESWWAKYRKDGRC